MKDINKLSREKKIENFFEKLRDVNVDVIEIYDLTQKNPFLIKARDVNGNTALHHAAISGDVDKAQYLVAGSVNVVENSFGKEKNILLETPNKMVVDVNVTNNFKNNVFHHLARNNGRADFIRCLIELGSGFRASSAIGEGGNTPLHLAICKNNQDLVKLFLPNAIRRSHVENIDVKNNSGKTPLNLAAGLKDEESVRLLCAAGADVNIKDNEDLKPIHSAICGGSMKSSIIVDCRSELIVDILMSREAERDKKFCNMISFSKLANRHYLGSIEEGIDVDSSISTLSGDGFDYLTQLDGQDADFNDSISAVAEETECGTMEGLLKNITSINLHTPAPSSCAKIRYSGDTGNGVSPNKTARLKLLTHQSSK